MAFNRPPNTPPGPPGGGASPPPPPRTNTITLAQASAMGTTQGAPVMQIAKGPPAGSGLPGSGPPPAQPGNNQQPQATNAATPAAGPPAPAHPVVASHAGQKSVGTHASRSPNKRVNPTHGMAK